MGREMYPHPRRVLAVWTGALLLAAAAVYAANTALIRRVDVMREQSPWKYLAAAEQLRAQNDWVGAIRMLEEAARRDPHSPLPHERAGFLYYEQGKQWTKALEAFRNALARGSTDPQVRGKAIWCLIHLEHYDAAAELGKKCIEEGDPAPYYPRYVAEAYRHAGKDAESIPYFEQALQGFPNDLYLMERLLQAHRNVGNAAKAEALEQRINYLAEQ